MLVFRVVFVVCIMKNIKMLMGLCNFLCWFFGLYFVFCIRKVLGTQFHLVFEFLRSIVWLSFVIIFFHLVWLYVVLCDSFFIFIFILLVIVLASIDSSPTRKLWDQPGFSVVAAIWLSKCYFFPCFFVAPIGPPSRWSSCCFLGPQTGSSSPFRLFFWSSILVVIEFYGVIV